MRFTLIMVLDWSNFKQEKETKSVIWLFLFLNRKKTM